MMPLPLLDAVTAAIVIIRDERITYANSAAARLLEVTVGRLVGSRFRDLIAPEQAVLLHDWRVFDNTLIAFPLSHDAFQWARVTGRTIEMDGAPAMLMTLQPTDQYDADLLRTLIDNIPDVVYVKDEALRFVLVNHAMTHLMQLMGLHFDPIGHLESEMLPPDIAVAAAREDEIVLSTGLPRLNIEAEFVYMDGTRHWFSCSKLPLRDPSGRVVGIVGIERDITEQRRMVSLTVEQERLRVALQKEHELNDLKSKMMTRISHEFRTPLSKIQLSSEMLVRYADRVTPEQRERQISEIKGQIAYLTETLGKIHYFVHGVFDATEFTLTTCNLATTARQHVDSLRAGGGESLRMIEWTTEPGTYTVLANQEFLHHIVRNVLTNAVQYSHPGSRIDVSLIHEDDDAVLCVEDQGIGISDDDMLHIFEPFYRGENVNPTAGIGLGLSIVKYALELLGGSVEAKSKLGVGSTFKVRLPLLP